MDRSAIGLVVVLISGFAVLVAWAMARHFQGNRDEHQKIVV